MRLGAVTVLSWRGGLAACNQGERSRKNELFHALTLAPNERRVACHVAGAAALFITFVVAANKSAHDEGNYDPHDDREARHHRSCEKLTLQCIEN